MSVNRKFIISTIIAATTAVIVCVLAKSPVGKPANFYIANRSENQIREYLGKDPQLSNRLKLFVFDDVSFAKYKAPALSNTDWAKIIDRISSYQPKAIIIDQIFGTENTSSGDIIAFKEAITKAGNVSAGSFVSNFLIYGRNPLPTDRKDYNLGRYTKDSVTDITWLPSRSPYIYGPNKILRDAFAHIGSILYPGNGRIDPFVRISANAAVPHITLFAADKVEVTKKGLLLNGRDVPLDNEYQIAVNFPSTSKFYQKAISLHNLLRNGEPRSGPFVNKDDVVIISPNFFTGNLDTQEGATGRIPGVFILSSIVNSILNDNWITPADHTVSLVLLLSVLGMLIGYYSSALSFWPILFGFAGTFFVSSIALFVYQDVQVSWLFPLGSLMFTATTCYGVSMVEKMIETQKLKDALKGAVPEAKLREIVSNKGRLHLDASERVVTLMFLDIANFSVVSEQQTPRDTFLYLKETLREITKTIHKYGGTVDRTLGDGILCFFGYSYDGEISENQADQAIRCAIEIQKTNIERCIGSSKSDKVALPFRIGLNTSSVYIGDIGNEDRIDFTVIGNGVNYAQRLEAACEHHSLMVSGTTMDFSTIFNARMPGFKKRFINIKHHEELLEAIEYNPFYDSSDKISHAQQAFRKSNNLERKEQRWPVTESEKIKISTEFGTATLVDFSSSGFCIEISSYLSKGVQFDLDLAFQQGDLQKTAQDLGINSIKAEVRWGKTTEKGFSHGVRITNLSNAQLENLFKLLRTTFNRNSQESHSVA